VRLLRRLAQRLLHGPVIGALACALLISGCATTPEPFTDQEFAARAARDKRIIAQTVPLDQALYFGTAAAHALANNLDIRLAAFDAVLARGQVDLADLQKLPTLVRNAGYTFRDPPGQTADKVPGDQRRYTFSTELSWSVLDFGISYIRAKQAANDVLVSEERRRRATNSIVNDVRLAFWQAALGDERLPQIRDVTAEIDLAMQQSRKLADIGLQDPLVALNYQQGLLDLRRQLKTYETEVFSGRTRLARLLNVHPQTPIRLQPVRNDREFEALRTIDMTKLEDVALANRAELREADYNVRKTKLDVYGAYAQMLPTFRIRFAQMFDGTTSIEDKNWYEHGYNAAWNILGIYSSFERAQQFQRTVQSIELRRLALSLSVMEQVDISRELLTNLEEDWRLARDTTEVNRRIWDIRKLRLPINESDDLERIRAAVSYVAAQIREDRAYTALQKAYGDMLASIGIDQFPEGLDLTDPAVAGKAIQGYQTEIPKRIISLAGQVPQIPAPDNGGAAAK
jgi:outer membrane protein TolC